MAKILIAYYSRKGQNYVNGEIKDLAKGNTEIIAEFIQKAVGGQLFEIVTLKDYPIDYAECTEVAKVEIRQKARPELKNYLASIADFDTIFLGFPIWWSIPPMAVSTFLEHYDFSGKKIIPFATHEGSGLGGSVSYLRKICPKAQINDGLAVHGAQAAAAEKTVVSWAKASL
jgi:flavodoxin